MRKISSAPPGKARHQKNQTRAVEDRLYPHLSFVSDGPRQSQARVIYDSKPPLADLLPRPEHKHHQKKRHPELRTRFKSGPGWRVEYA